MSETDLKTQERAELAAHYISQSETLKKAESDCF